MDSQNIKYITLDGYYTGSIPGLLLGTATMA